ncbi:hypothetical protein [Brevundimonas sp.]|uniref:hypothetical protein n=1 Tax=Brevundimonas sp. TaxID=1871086 RepID=UPI002ED8FC8E
MTEAEAREIVERYEALLAAALGRLPYPLEDGDVPRLVIMRDDTVGLEVISADSMENDDGNPCGGMLSSSYFPARFDAPSSRP